MVDPKVILFALVTAIIIGAIIYTFIFRKPEPKPEVDFEEEVEEVEEPSPDTVDEVMTGGDDEPVPEEDETSLETGPVDDELVEETSNVNIISETSNVNVVVEGYMLKK
tara:strand:+ start:5545 stop:5871 length:327 start_codon:yes stop_codon:yes gene_type:complete